VIEALNRLISTYRCDGRTARMLGLVATQFGDFEVAKRFLDIAATDLRAEGRLTLLASGLVLRSLSAIYLGDRDVAITNADEGERLATETGQPIYASAARAVSAIIAAMRGDHDAAESLAAEAQRMTDPLGTLLAEVQMARGLNALAAGRFEEAYHQYSRMFTPTDSAYHPMKECFWIGDLAEAALQSGHREVARAKLLEMEDLARRTPSPQFHQSMHYARAMLADQDDAEQVFETGLGAVSAPFLQARLQLAFGRWPRRAGRGRQAHVVLQAAMESFDRLCASPWGERARKELRALGVIVQRRTPERREELTPQELQIALMAAEGLSNREIGQRLYLSHRTVSSHLYRVFPKLDITSRHQLPSVLASERAVAT
jgi:ATP/maltotriose-dependent transcriptional regulator MalT